MVKRFLIQIAIICCLSLWQASAVAAKSQTQLDIIHDVEQIAYGSALVKFCPIVSANDYISFMQDLMMAERIITFEHGSAYKYISHQQDVLAYHNTLGGKNCSSDILVAISKAEILMKKFSSTSVLRDELVINHPKYPKLNQAFIFASYLQARLAWIYQRKCHILDGAELDAFNLSLLKTQAELELVFRLEQITALTKRMPEAPHRAALQRCDVWDGFVDYAKDVMIDDIPDSLEILTRHYK